MPTSGVRGDFKKLANLQLRLKRLSGRTARLEMSKACAEAVRTEALIGFQRSIDPYDKPWPKLRSRDGQPLRDSGLLQNSLAGKDKIRVRATGFTLTTNRKGAATHQYGATIRAKNARIRFGGAGGDGMDVVTAGKPMLRFRVGGARPRGHGRGATGHWVQKEQVTIPRRQFVPEGSAGRRWGAAIYHAADDYILLKMGGR